VIKLLHFKTKGLCAAALVILLFCSLVGPAHAASKPVYNESLVRAAVIFGVLRFTSWPESFKPQGELRLCAVGESASASAIASLEKIPSIGSTLIIYSNGPADLSQCHAVIAGEDEAVNLGQSNAALLICDSCNASIMASSSVVLQRTENRIQFEINLDRVQESELSLSSSLIELAARCSSTNPAIRGCDD